MLTPTARVKPQKRGGGGGGGGQVASSGGQFSLRRRGRFRADELDFDDMVCPLSEGVPNNVSNGANGVDGDEAIKSS